MSGGVVSTIHEYEAGVESVLPAASTARTANVWLPSGAEIGSPEVQVVNTAPSRLHLKWSTPLASPLAGSGSLPLNVKTGFGSLEALPGLLPSVVSGSAVSIVKK